MRNRTLLAATVTTLFAGQALAVTPDRIRGAITAVDATKLTIAEAGGKTETVALTADTKYAGLTASSLDAVQKGDFIGTATKGSRNFMVALEVLIFPDSMRGTGEGQYPWDRITDTTMSAPHGGSMLMASNSTMTNGTVSAAHSSGGGTTNSTMTNGTVSAAGSGSTKTITVTYDGKSSQIIVPPTAPIVKLTPGDKSLATVGGKVFVIAAGSPLAAKFVAVGQDGTVPPM